MRWLSQVTTAKRDTVPTPMIAIIEGVRDETAKPVTIQQAVRSMAPNARRPLRCSNRPESQVTVDRRRIAIAEVPSIVP